MAESRNPLNRKSRMERALAETAKGGNNLTPIQALKPLPPTKPEVAARNQGGKYEAILKGAIRVFARNGFFNSKVADVAREAGVADGTVYLYFKNKDDILVSIFNQVMNEALGRKERFAGTSDPAELLRRVVHSHLERFARDRDLAIVFQVELRSSSKFMEQFSANGVTQYIRMIGGFIKLGQAQGIFRPELNSTLTAKILFGALDEMVTNWVLSKKPSDLISTGDAVIEVLLNGIQCATLEK